jgi:L-histidine N-alpha-methyltransferase
MESAEIAVGLTDAFAEDVRRGLTAPEKHLDPRYFYDALGSALFAAICELPEYYVTRAEREILDRSAGEIAASFGQVTRLVELGSGNARKTQRLIEALSKDSRSLVYRPIDVDESMLAASSREITAQFPSVSVDPKTGDFMDVGALGHIPGRTAILFLGSSIGNLDHRSAAALLREMRKIVTADDAIFVGFDLVKSSAILDAAYNDSLGVTAAFNRNILARINRELGGSFRLDAFAHHAFFNEAESRIEMHLVSMERQQVRIAALDLEVEFARDESIHTENSYKYDAATIERLAAEAGLRVERRWVDTKGWFADVLFRAL